MHTVQKQGNGSNSCDRQMHWQDLCNMRLFAFVFCCTKHSISAMVMVGGHSNGSHSNGVQRHCSNGNSNGNARRG